MSSLMINSRLKSIRFEESFGMADYDWLPQITKNNETAEITECLVTMQVTQANHSLSSEYRQKDYYYSLYFLENYRKNYPRGYATAVKRLNGTRVRYFYLLNDMKEARRFFIRSEFNYKQVAYFKTSFLGSRFIKGNFAISG